MTLTVRPSGDLTGASDVVSINAALSGSTECILSGTYHINASLEMPSKSTLTLNDAFVHLVPGANTNMVRNADQSPGGAGDHDLVIQGSGVAVFDGNASGQAGGSGQGFLFQNVSGLQVNNVTIGPTFRMAVMQYRVFDANWQGIELAQDATTLNQDGIDVGPGCQRIYIDNVTGRTGDDGFSIFAKNTGGNTTPFSSSLTELERNVSDVFISNIVLDVGINPVRLQAGDGSTLSRVFISNFINTRQTSVAINGDYTGVLQFGPTRYVTDPPNKADLGEIYLNGYRGPSAYVVNAESNFSHVTANSVELLADNGRQSSTLALLGCAQHIDKFAPDVDAITIAGASISGDVSNPMLVALPKGSTASNIAIVGAQRLATNSSILSEIVTADVQISSISLNDEMRITFDGVISNAVPGVTIRHNIVRNQSG